MSVEIYVSKATLQTKYISSNFNVIYVGVYVSVLTEIQRARDP